MEKNTTSGSSISRLLQMQARYQQKQMQEREMKIASLYEAQQARALDRVRHPPSSGARAAASPPPAPAPAIAPAPAPATGPMHPGKVRQMFEERRGRTKPGIDKSYPLQPIQNTERPAPRKHAMPNGHAKLTSSTTNARVTVEKRTVKHTSTTSVKKQHHKMESIVNGSGDLNQNHEPNLNSVNGSLPKSNGELITSVEELDGADNYLLENETFPEALAPTPTPRSPDPAEPKRPPRRSPPVRTTSVSPKPRAPPRRVISENTVNETSKARGAMHRTSPAPKRQPVVNARQGLNAPGSKRATASPASASEGNPCSVCGRRFAPDRLATHQEICKKSQNKKRKPFDALKHRLAGTEAEPFIGKLRRQTKTTNSSATNTKTLNSNWRQKHEEFIQAIRAAKQVQAHLNAGGKLSDLPPPPPSENPDYVQCPHCSRRFNQGAAERHIPKCATFQFNKTKPAPARRR